MLDFCHKYRGNPVPRAIVRHTHWVLGRWQPRQNQRDLKSMLAPAELREIHPLGKSPVLVDDENTVAESGAIIEYLVERHDAAHALAPEQGSPETR